MLDITIAGNGALQIRADCDGLEHLADYRAERCTVALWSDLLESYSCNGSYSLISPEHIGALTDAPIIAESVDYDESGIPSPVGRVWFFADYALRDEMAELESGQTVTFTLAD